MGVGHTHSGDTQSRHTHSHDPAEFLRGRRDGARRLTWALGLVVIYLAAEVVGGFVTGSLALLADAGHMLSDAGSLGLALFALRMARRPARGGLTYGFHRLEILAALANGAALVAISVIIIVEAIDRFAAPPPVDAPWMMVVAAGGLLINLAGLALLHGGRSENLNLQGAWLHVLTDALGSVQALAAGALIWLFGWNWADPVASVLIALLVTFSAWSLLKEAVAVLMESAPGHIDVDEVRTALLATPGVLGIHDLHVWTITSGFVSLSAHVVAAEGQGQRALLERLREVLRQKFGIEHVTLQIEPGEALDVGDCRAC